MVFIRFRVLPFNATDDRKLVMYFKHHKLDLEKTDMEKLATKIGAQKKRDLIGRAFEYLDKS